jgi:hypothetical protein
LTWPKEQWLLLDELGGCGYSSICSVDDNTLGILYEGSGGDIVFQAISIGSLFITPSCTEVKTHFFRLALKGLSDKCRKKSLLIGLKYSAVLQSN